MATKMLIGLMLVVTSISHSSEIFGQSAMPDLRLSENLLLNPENFMWLNKPEAYAFNNGTLEIIAEKGTDFFNNPEDKSITSTAPLMYLETEGDFVATALVKPDFSSQWNAVSLMVHIDDKRWIKFAFENSDATGPGIVSVVTEGSSDDANGVMLNDQDQIWLKLIRKGGIYSMLWSNDGKDYKMTRLTSLPSPTVVKIGVEAQCPVGDSARHEVHFFNVKNVTVDDLRKGE